MDASSRCGRWQRASPISEHLYVIGRGPSYPMALEAALKIKEVSYMHAEGFAGASSSTA